MSKGNALRIVALAKTPRRKGENNGGCYAKCYILRNIRS